MHDTILKALNWRYATQVFNSTKKVSDQDLTTILESGRLSPSSFGIEPWKFIVVTNPVVRAKLKEVGYGQAKITDASHLIVVAYRTDYDNLAEDRINEIAKVQNIPATSLSGLKDMIAGTVSGRTSANTIQEWVKAQSYIPLGIMIETAALLGIDGGPMEGFDADAVDAVLGLKEKQLHATTMLALGYRGTDPAAERPKVRRPLTAVVEYIN
jgi:nitroreductase